MVKIIDGQKLYSIVYKNRSIKWLVLPDWRIWYNGKYLKHSHWLEDIRPKTIEKHEGMCVLCGAEARVVHHWVQGYNHLWAEEPGVHTGATCVSCHSQKIHELIIPGGIARQPSPTLPPDTLRLQGIALAL